MIVLITSSTPNRARSRAAMPAHQEGERQRNEAETRHRQRHGGGGRGAREELTLGTDVEHAGAERDGYRATGQH
jgi:hypothetical protein